MTTSDRYPWRIEVEDAHGRRRTLGIGTKGGRVIYALIDDAGHISAFFSAIPDASDLISAGSRAASLRATQWPLGAEV